MNGLFEVREKIDLKPCPFCGGKAHITGMFIPTGDGDEINAYLVGCEECDVSFTQDWYYKDIVRKWNTRGGEEDERK